MNLRLLFFLPAFLPDLLTHSPFYLVCKPSTDDRDPGVQSRDSAFAFSLFGFFSIARLKREGRSSSPKVTGLWNSGLRLSSQNLCLGMLLYPHRLCPCTLSLGNFLQSPNQKKSLCLVLHRHRRTFHLHLQFSFNICAPRRQGIPHTHFWRYHQYLAWCLCIIND